MTNVTLYGQTHANIVLSSNELKKGIYKPDSMGGILFGDLGDVIWRVSKSIDNNASIKLLDRRYDFKSDWTILITGNNFKILLTSLVYQAFSWKGGDPRFRIIKIEFDGDEVIIKKIIRKSFTLTLEPPYQFYNFKKFTKKFGIEEDQIITDWKKWL